MKPLKARALVSTICKTFGKLLLLAAFLVFSLEGIVRVAALASAHRVDQTAYGNFLGDLKPNQELVSQEIPELSYRIHVNSQGLRGPELRPLDSDHERILILGDSIAFGLFVNDDETLPAQVEQNLLHHYATDNFEIINAARCGYTISDELQYFSEKGKFLRPNKVLLVYSIGDEIEYAFGWTQRKDSLARGKFRGTSSPLIHVEEILRQSAGLYWLQQKLMVWTLRAGRPPGSTNPLSFYSSYDETPSPFYLKALNNYIDELERLRKATNENGAELVLAIFPSHRQFDQKIKRKIPQEFLAAYAQQTNLPFVDLTPSLERRGTEKDLFFMPINRHPKPLAYQTAGKVLADFLAAGTPKRKTKLASNTP